jgi:periplasmic protein TonB
MEERPTEFPERSPEVLSRCLVEGDETALADSRRRRRRALMISIVLEAALLAGLVLLAMFVTTARPSLLEWTPLRPYYGSPRVVRQANADTSGPQQPRPHKRFTLPHLADSVRPRAPHPSPDAVPGLEKEDDVPVIGGGPGFGNPRGLLPPLGNSDSRGVFPPAPTPPAKNQRPHRVSEGVEEALLVDRVQPVYPPLALQAQLEGTVRLHAIVGRDGAVKALEVISGHPILAWAARAAVVEWRYRPTLLNGEPVEVETYITVIFQLQR